MFVLSCTIEPTGSVDGIRAARAPSRVRETRGRARNDPMSRISRARNAASMLYASDVAARLGDRRPRSTTPRFGAVATARVLVASIWKGVVVAALCTLL